MQIKKDEWIFVHVPKTAGESITEILNPHSDYMFDQHDTLFRAYQIEPYWFLSMWKFGFVRNPYDREVSNYFWHTKLNDKYDISFEDWVKWRYKEDKHPPLNWKHFREPKDYWYHKGFGKNPQVGFFIEPNGRWLHDFIGRFETLQEDWNVIAEKIDVTKELPHSGKTDHVDYREYYKDEEVYDLVTKAHQIDLDAFNYDFEKGMISKEINMDIPINVHLHYNYNYYYG